MITTSDFKKQVAKPFGQEMRNNGFKGTGFEYKQETDDYLIAVYISPSRWGGSCSAGFAIHPKIIDKDSEGKKDLTKLKTYQYEFRFGLTPYARGEKWKFSEEEQTNLETLSVIIDTLKNKAFPVINQFKASPSILDQFDVTEMDKFHENWVKRTGVSVATADLRFAWAMTLIYEHKNLEKAKQFANWTVSEIDIMNSTWFATNDLKRILNKNNGA